MLPGRFTIINFQEPDNSGNHANITEIMPKDRFFDILEGINP